MQVSSISRRDVRRPGRQVGRLLSGLAPVLVLALPAAAQAQAQAPAQIASADADATAGAVAASQSVGIADILVTAQKRTEVSQDVPIALSVMSGAALAQQNIQSAVNLGGKLPNVQVLLPYGDAQPQFVIRGVTTTDLSFNQSGPIALYYDGIFKSVGALQAMPMFDVERIEVLRGPQGTLQGRNSTGGAVQINSNPPVFDLTGSVMAGVGNYGRYEGQAVLNVPIVDDLLAVRVAGYYLNVDGYIKNLMPGEPGRLHGSRDLAGRLSVLLTPGAGQRYVLRVSGMKSDPYNFATYAKDIGPGGAGIPPGLIPGVGPTGYDRAGLGFFENYSQNSQRREIESLSVSLTADWDIGDTLTLTSITSYDKGHWLSPENDAGTPERVYDARFYSRVKTFQQEARLASAFDGPYNFQLGVVYANESLDMRSRTEITQYQPAIIDFYGEPFNICLNTYFYTCGLNLQFHQIRRDRAVFFSNSLDVTDRLKLTIGARYTHGKVGVSGYRTSLDYIDPATGLDIPPIDLIPGDPTDPLAAAPAQSVVNRKWSGNVLLEYQLASSNMLYGSFSRGFRGSSYNAGAYFSVDAINAVKPEVLDAFEIGSKNRFLDDRLQVNAAAFLYSYKNQQFSSVNTETGFQLQYNVPSSKIYGAELEVVAQPAPDLNLHVALGWMPRARYDSGIVSGFDISGNRMVSTPKLSYSVSADWKFLATPDADFNIFAEANGVSGQYFNSNNDMASYQPGFGLVNLRLTAKAKGSDLSLSAYVQNLFEKKYFANILDTRDFINMSFAIRGLPRTFGLQARYGF